MAKKSEKASLTNPIRETRAVPIGDYGFLSDGEVSALLSRRAARSTGCACPASTRRASSADARPARRVASGSRRSTCACPPTSATCPGTMILETSWGTPTGWIIVRDALLIGPWHHDDGPVARPTAARRTTTRPSTSCCGPSAASPARCRRSMDCEPVLDYGRTHVRWEYTGDGYHQGGRTAEGADVELTLTTDLRLGFEGGQASARTLLKEGDIRFVALSWGGAPPPTNYAEAYQRQVWTAHHWQHWLARGKFPDHPWRSYLQRSALTLKGLTYAPTGRDRRRGDDLAARDPGRRTQLRLPVHLDPGRHVRAVGHVLPRLRLGGRGLLLLHRRRRRAARTTCRSCTASAASGSSTEYELDHLPGYANSRPVRIGNAAYAQKQHDVWGALLDSVYLHFKAADHLDNRIWPILDKQVSEALKYWREPDAGHLGGPRGAPALHLVQDHVLGGRRPRRQDRPDDAARTARPPSGSWPPRRSRTTSSPTASTTAACFTQYYGSKALDASLLLAPLVRFLPADDPRIRATVLAIADELTVHGLVLRYKVEETDDGFSGEEGSFTICSFWLVSALCEIGEYHRARKLCAKLLSFAGPLRAVRRGDRPAHRPAPRQLPAGLHPPGPDQRRAARDQARGARQLHRDHRAGLVGRDGGMRPGRHTPCPGEIAWSPAGDER